MDGITSDDTELVDDPSFVNVSKLAVQYSDAVIQGSPKINTEITEFIQSSGKSFLDYQPEHTYIDAYNDFYDKVL
jgi:starch synthase